MKLLEGAVRLSRDGFSEHDLEVLEQMQRIQVDINSEVGELSTPNPEIGTGGAPCHHHAAASTPSDLSSRTPGTRFAPQLPTPRGIMSTRPAAADGRITISFSTLHELATELEDILKRLQRQAGGPIRACPARRPVVEG